jgi:hypothetical protein
MQFTKSLKLIILISVASLRCFSQNVPPPAMAMPTNENLNIVNRIIRESHYDDYFYAYCQKHVSEYANKEGWTREKTKQVMQSVNFDDFQTSVQNWFSFYSKDELELILSTIKILNANPRGQRMVITNLPMQNNLEGYIQMVLKGKYLPASN